MRINIIGETICMLIIFSWRTSPQFSILVESNTFVLQSIHAFFLIRTVYTCLSTVQKSIYIFFLFIDILCPFGDWLDILIFFGYVVLVHWFFVFMKLWKQFVFWSVREYNLWLCRCNSGLKIFTGEIILLQICEGLILMCFGIYRVFCHIYAVKDFGTSTLVIWRGLW